jgi:hypothetical protein
MDAYNQKRRRKNYIKKSQQSGLFLRIAVLTPPKQHKSFSKNDALHVAKEACRSRSNFYSLRSILIVVSSV